MIVQSFIKFYFNQRVNFWLSIIDEIRCRNIEGVNITYCFYGRGLTQIYLKFITNFFNRRFFGKTHLETAAALELNAFVKAVEEGRNAKDHDNNRNSVSDLSVLDESNIGMLEDAFADAGEILKVTFLAGKPISNPAANQYAAEQRQQDTEDLCSSKSF